MTESIGAILSQSDSQGVEILLALFRVLRMVIVGIFELMLMGIYQ